MHARAAVPSQPAAAAGEQSEPDSDADTPSNSTAEELSPAEYRRKFQMTVDARNAPAPWQTFEEAQLPPPLLTAVSTGSVAADSSQSNRQQ